MPLLMFLLGSMWAVASPPGSSADDDYHLTSIWCAWGDSESCLVTSKPGTVLVPEQVAQAPCFALNAYTDGSCTRDLSTRLVATTRVNPQWGTYPPVYYATMRAFVGHDVARSVIVMRVANVLIASLMLAFALAISAPALRRATAMSWSLLLVPVVIFFVASTNPSSWVITGVGTFWVFVLALVRNHGWRTRLALGQLVGAVVAAVLALSARADAAIYIGASLIAIAILEWPRIRARAAKRPRLVLGVGVGLVVVLAIAATNLRRYLRQSVSFPGADLDTDQPNALIKTLLELPAFLAGILGGQEPGWSQKSADLNDGIQGYSEPGFTFGIGWTDVNNPSLSGIFVAAAVAGALFVGFTRYSRRRVLAVAWLALVLVGQVVMMRAWVGFGSVWFLQPRYFVPLVLVIVGLALLVAPARRPLFSPVQRWAVVLLLTTGAAVSYAATLARYTKSQSASFVNLSVPPTWWWDTPIQTSHLVIAATVVSAALFVTATSAVVRRPA